MSWFGWVAIAVGVVLLSAVLVRRSYRRDLRAAYERLDSLSRRSVESRWATHDYAIGGEGRPEELRPSVWPCAIPIVWSRWL